jgi:hypothetical protein
LVIGLVGVLLPRLAAAQTPPPPPAPPPAPASTGVDIGALTDVYYDWYANKPNISADAPYRNFDTKHNQFALSMAELWLAKAPTSDSRVGFKFKLNFGSATSNFIHAAEPGGQPYHNIQEAYASYLAPVGTGLQLDAGVFVTPLGAEVIEAKDNPNYSRGLLFSLAIPYYHSGVRATYNATDKVTVSGGVVNGWNNIVENNTAKTLLGSITLKPTGALTIAENYIAGEEQPNSTFWRNVSDTVVTYTATPMVTLIGNYDWGHEAIPGGSVMWQGFAGYAKIQVDKMCTFTPRFEWYDDRDGATTGGTPQKLKEFTATLELRANDNLQWRLEYRGDWSDIKPFLDSDGKPTDKQNSIGFALLYSWSGKIQ